MMKTLSLSLAAAMLIPALSFAGSRQVPVGNQTIRQEFDRLAVLARSLQNPIETVGGIVSEQPFNFPDPAWAGQGYTYSLMWTRSGDPESNFRSYALVVRGPAGESLSVATYEGWTEVSSGAFLVRRIIGEDSQPRRFDTIDYAGGGVLAVEGVQEPVLTEVQEALLNAWEIGRY